MVVGSRGGGDTFQVRGSTALVENNLVGEVAVDVVAAVKEELGERVFVDALVLQAFEGVVELDVALELPLLL